MTGNFCVDDSPVLGDIQEYAETILNVYDAEQARKQLADYFAEKAVIMKQEQIFQFKKEDVEAALLNMIPEERWPSEESDPNETVMLMVQKAVGILLSQLDAVNQQMPLLLYEDCESFIITKQDVIESFS